LKIKGFLEKWEKPRWNMSDQNLSKLASFEFVDAADSEDMGDAVTRSQLINRLAEHYPQLVAKDAEEAVRTILDAMGKALAEGHRIEIRGFGSFALSHRPSRVGRNPKSGAKVVVPPKRVPHFKPGKELRERVDQALPLEAA
jgi:integration host factor subunit beta